MPAAPSPQAPVRISTSLATRRYAGDYFIGAIYDVRIYERALSAAEIQALYQSVTPPPPTSEWVLNQSNISGATVQDAVGNGDVGTLVNGPLTFGTMGANFNGSQYVDAPRTAGPAYQIGCSSSGFWFDYTVNFNGAGQFTLTCKSGRCVNWRFMGRLFRRRFSRNAGYPKHRKPQRIPIGRIALF